MATQKSDRLDPAKVKALSVPGTYSDGDGLTLRVAASGSKSWVLRATVDGKRVNISMGGYPTVGLGAARRKAEDHRRAIQDGENPIAAKRVAKEAADKLAGLPTFAVAARQVIELRRPTWTSQRHAQQWIESLTNHAFPAIGHLRVDRVTTADVMAVLTPIWTAKAETATRVQQRMAKVFDYAIVMGWRATNPASVAVTAALPRRPRLKAHHPALDYGDVASAVAAVRESTADAPTRLAFEWMVLTASRAGETRGMERGEIDLDSRTWTVPAARMKSRKEHRVPLADQAVAILGEAGAVNRNGLVFPSKRSGQPLSNMAFTGLLRRLELPCVPHGFRASFRDWTIAETSTPWAVGEAALAHTLGNSVESAYARTDLFERRRELMQAWADFVGCVP